MKNRRKARQQQSLERCCEEFDAKEKVLEWAARGELSMGLPLHAQMQRALEQLGFNNVGVQREPTRDVWMLRADIGANINCPNPRTARANLHRMARRVGQRLTRCVDYLVIRDGTLRAGVMFVNASRID